MSKSVPCITTADEFRKVTAEQSTHKEDVLSDTNGDESWVFVHDAETKLQSSELHINTHTLKEKVVGNKISAEYLAEHFDNLCLILFL